MLQIRRSREGAGMQKRWLVDLSEAERAELEALTRRGKAPARKIAHARVLLLAAEGLTDGEIAAATGRSRSLVERTRKRFVLSGFEAALWDKPRPGGVPKLDERGRATLIALACANPPHGRTCWTMQLLANELVIRQVVPSISDETVRRELKKTASSRGSRSTGAFRRSVPAS
jgi:transposase